MNRQSGGGGAGATRTANVERTQEFFRGLVSEMKRVTWPTQQEWVAATILTIALVVGASVYTYVLDWVFAKLFLLVHP